MRESLRLEVKLIPYILLESTGMQVSKSLSSCTKTSRLLEKTIFFYIKTKHSHTLLFDRELIHFVPLDHFLLPMNIPYVQRGSSKIEVKIMCSFNILTKTPQSQVTPILRFLLLASSPVNDRHQTWLCGAMQPHNTLRTNVWSPILGVELKYMSMSENF